jgi:hypothetical protein
LKHVVDDVSDDEGDEEAGDVAHKQLEQREEKQKHKEILRRMREKVMMDAVEASRVVVPVLGVCIISISW